MEAHHNITVKSGVKVKIKIPMKVSDILVHRQITKAGNGRFTEFRE